MTAAAARTGHDDEQGLDLTAIAPAAAILRDCEGSEHVVLADGPRRLRLQLRGDSVAEGPVRLACDLPGRRHLDDAALSLRRLAAIVRLGRLPAALYPPDPIVLRRVRALQAWEGARAGAGQRDIAIAVFGRHMVTEQSFYSMRKRVHRLLRQAETQIDAAWRRFCAET